MLASIHPLGERSRNMNFGVTAVAYLIGSITGGVLTGSLFGALGAMLLSEMSSAGTAAVAAVVVAAGVLFDLGVVRLPTPKRQVNEDWLTTYRGWVYGAGYGFQLGAGILTIVTSASVYATFALALLSGSWVMGGSLGAVFGAGRALVLWSVASVTTPEALRELHRRMQYRAALAHRSAVAAQLVVMLVAAGVLAWP